MLIDLPVLDSASAQPPSSSRPGAVRAWSSLPHYHGADAFRNRSEFGPRAATPPTASNRRTFLKLMGASMAMAGLTACRRPVEKILPYARKPEEVVPGKPLFYASAMPFGGIVQPLLVESHEGRPTKVEPNPQHPYAGSGTNGYAQASVLNLYDPDRSKRVRRNGADSTWAEFVEFCRGYQPNGQVAVLAEPSSSPTLARLRGLLEERFPDVRWTTYSAAADAASLGMQMAFGRPLRPLFDFSQARVIVSLDADFLAASNPNMVQANKSYADSRRVDGPEATMSRHYAVEATYSMTGMMADHRLRLKPSEIPAFAAALAARLGVAEAASAGAVFADHPWVEIVAADLEANRGAGVLVPGPSQPPVVHALCALANEALGSTGSVVSLLDTGETEAQADAEALADLVAAMQRGEVDTLLMLGTNPLYDAPADLDVAAAFTRVPNTIHVGGWIDETALNSAWHVPASHYLEAWGDGRAYDGTLSVIQPLIAPLYATKSEIEVLHTFATGLDRSGYDLVRETWRGQIPGDFEAGWREVLHDGFLPNTGYPAVGASGGSVEAEALAAIQPSAPDMIDIGFTVDNKVYDGRFANNAWMQEVPHTSTKVVWDNVAMMSPATRRALGLQWEYEEGVYEVDLIELTVDGRSVVLPVWEVPGHADNAITVDIGYGRELLTDREFTDLWFWDVDVDIYNIHRAPLANGVGTSVAPLRTTAGMRMASGVEVRPVGETYTVVSTQDNYAVYDGDRRAGEIIRMATLDAFRANPDFAEEVVPPIPGGEPWDEYPPLWNRDDPYDTEFITDGPYVQNQWGMVIDLNTCTGCTACVVACQSENNIPVVGKEQCGMGREMSWMRIDRYYVGEDTGEPMMVSQPMLCQHCEDAPCEPVCPVAATVHSPDGMNMMIYNRCIGTRYCANNCPYNVRRFNYYNWTVNMPVTVQMAQNPNVTVRFRGVMEKCQYCVQRIREVGIQAKVEERPIRDGEIETACQQACPANAITFGDVSEPASAVSLAKANPRNYEVLPELNVKPRTSYLARLRNPNPILEAGNV